MDKQETTKRESEREQALIKWATANAAEFSAVHNKPYFEIGPQGRALIADARLHVGYSPATINRDIWRTLVRVHKKISK